MQSAGLMAVHQTKLDRYALLAALAERQVLDGLRASAPTILPVAVSTHGEFCPGAVRVQEWLTGKYRARLLLEGDRDDGEKTEGLTAAFRREFRSSLLVASCKGLADMLIAAGMPFAGKRAHGRSSACGGGAHAPPPLATAPPSGRGNKRAERSEEEDPESEGAEAGCSTASSSDDDAGEHTTSRGPSRRSARLAEQASARAVPVARTPTSNSDAPGADSSMGSAACGARSGESRGSGSGARRGRAQPSGLQRLEHALTNCRRDHLRWLCGATGGADIGVDSGVDCRAGRSADSDADRSECDGALRGRAQPDNGSSGSCSSSSSSSSCRGSGSSSSNSSTSGSGRGADGGADGRADSSGADSSAADSDAGRSLSEGNSSSAGSCCSFSCSISSSYCVGSSSSSSSERAFLSLVVCDTFPIIT